MENVKWTNLLIGYDNYHGDVPCLAVGVNSNGKVVILNTIYGEEAEKLYEKLVTPVDRIAVVEKECDTEDGCRVNVNLVDKLAEI